MAWEVTNKFNKTLVEKLSYNLKRTNNWKNQEFDLRVNETTDSYRNAYLIC